MSALGEVRAALLAVLEHLRDAYRAADEAQQRVEESISAFTELGHAHPESLLPPELSRAQDAISASLARMAETADAVERYASLL